MSDVKEKLDRPARMRVYEGQMEDLGGSNRYLNFLIISFSIVMLSLGAQNYTLSLASEQLHSIIRFFHKGAHFHASRYGEHGAMCTYMCAALAANYFDDGFIRRGLPGSLLLLISHTLRDPMLGIRFLQLTILVWLVIPLTLILFSLRSRMTFVGVIYMAAVVALSSQTFRGWARDFARPDMLVEGFIAWAVIATLSGRRIVGIVMLLLGSLAHETALIFGFPLLLVINAGAFRAREIDSRAALGLTLLLLGGLLAILVGESLFSAPSSVVASHMLRDTVMGPGFVTPHSELLRDLAIYFEISGPRGVKAAVCQNLSFTPQYFFTAAACMTVLFVYAIILNLVRHPLSFLTVAIAPVLFLMLVTTDSGRWLMFGTVNLWLLAAARQIAGRAPEPMAPANLAVGTALFLVLVLMGPTRIYVANTVTRDLALRLGLADELDAPLAVSRCDPTWRALVYAGVRPPP